MPVAAIAGEARSVKAQHRANLAGTQPGNQAFETGSSHRPAGGKAEIVINDGNLLPAQLLGTFLQGVLAMLAAPSKPRTRSLNRRI